MCSRFYPSPSVWPPLNPNAEKKSEGGWFDKRIDVEGGEEGDWGKVGEMTNGHMMDDTESLHRRRRSLKMEDLRKLHVCASTVYILAASMLWNQIRLPPFCNAFSADISAHPVVSLTSPYILRFLRQVSSKRAVMLTWWAIRHNYWIMSRSQRKQFPRFSEGNPF